MQMENLPFLLSAGLILATFFAASFSSEKIRLPSVLVYILLGLATTTFLPHSQTIHRVAEIGIVLLFFILGLEFPLARIMEISKRIWMAGSLDILLNLGGAILLSLFFGLDFMSALIIGSIAYGTSSSISAKMIEEKKRVANPESEFILALLIFEDLVAPILVSLVSGARTGEAFSAGFAVLLFAKMLVLLTGAVLIGYFGFKKLKMFIARHMEKDFMVLLTIGIALAYAGLAVAMGLSEIMGAFLAGVMLSESEKSHELEALLLPTRDMTLPFFFFWFGSTISLGQGVPYVTLLLLLVVWGAIGKIVTAYAGGRMYGLTPKVSLRAGLSFVHRGEFSAIIASMALPHLKVFSGIYILATAFLGVYLFQKAPALANWYQKKQLRKPKKNRKEQKVATDSS